MDIFSDNSLLMLYNLLWYMHAKTGVTFTEVGKCLTDKNRLRDSCCTDLGRLIFIGVLNLKSW